MQPTESEHGFTLIEVLVALFILTIGILSLHLMQLSSIQGNASANRMSIKTANAEDRLEQLLYLAYNDANFNDAVDKDGTDQDIDMDGVDDNGGNFGLDDSQCCQNGNDPAGNVVPGCANRADFCQVIDNSFIYWNAAVDVPIKCSKTVKVLVRNINVDTTKIIEAQYVKSDPLCAGP
ncbi:MAG: prepilin-type N-terminal cleavage/methylation domain-containing protein [Chlorobium sp.]|nr:prepilin-type N-terminal cleavage/methylation domain-containing protein [Chlorobium sp.]